MAYQATVIPVMLASPGDVTDEREVARQVIHDWNYVHSSSAKIVLMPVGWDTHSSPELSGRPQELINNRVLKHCDLLVGIFWTRLGTPTGGFSSGTAEEIQRHVEAGRPAMVYFSDAPIAPSKFKKDQHSALEDFRTWCEGKGIIWTFVSTDDFRSKFTRQLQLTLQHNDYLQALTVPTNPPEETNSPEEEEEEFEDLLPALSPDARELLLEATLDDEAQIINGDFVDPAFFQTNRKTFGGEGSTARDRARWKHAMQQLESVGCIRPLSAKRQVFEVTHDGFELADSLRASGN